ncbi:hypothetical protein SNEBB_001251 [Seison nebaliae]|nr:hypothetical protein SNEBB_001251 [Seison nebaliae]
MTYNEQRKHMTPGHPWPKMLHKTLVSKKFNEKSRQYSKLNDHVYDPKSYLKTNTTKNMTKEWLACVSHTGKYRSGAPLFGGSRFLDSVCHQMEEARDAQNIIKGMTSIMSVTDPNDKPVYPLYFKASGLTDIETVDLIKFPKCNNPRKLTALGLNKMGQQCQLDKVPQGITTVDSGGDIPGLDESSIRRLCEDLEKFKPKLETVYQEEPAYTNYVKQMYRLATNKVTLPSRAPMNLNPLLYVDEDTVNKIVEEIQAATKVDMVDADDVLQKLRDNGVPLMEHENVMEWPYLDIRPEEPADAEIEVLPEMLAEMLKLVESKN